uniref:Uncharacterized protein n=1 Tax=Dictyoglomus turgidum TaxID=513050 RepID=A0A7C3SM75_9BACT
MIRISENQEKGLYKDNLIKELREIINVYEKMANYLMQEALEEKLTEEEAIYLSEKEEEYRQRKQEELLEEVLKNEL